MVSSDERPEQVLVEGIKLNLPAATVIPLGFIVSELIANAAKYGKGRIAISLQRNPECGYALSVSNDGPALPEGFDPDASKGLGMRIIRSFQTRSAASCGSVEATTARARDLPCYFQEWRADAVPGMLRPETIASRHQAIYLKRK